MKYSIKTRWYARILLVVFLSGELAHIPLIANTGPGSPESQSFAPAGIDNMVNLFTGDFQYNIPLLDVGGYPINLSYNSNIGTEDEASWTGLGWTLNPGSISRAVRGLPDDFKGDEIERQINFKDDKTFGLDMGFSAEIFGGDIPVSSGLGLSAGFEYNNYNGWDYTVGSSTSFNGAIKSGENQLSGSLGLSAGYSRSGGTFLRPTAGFSGNLSGTTRISEQVSANISSRKGLESVNFTTSLYRSHQKNILNKTSTISSLFVPVSNTFSLSKAYHSYTPSFDFPRSGISGSFRTQIGSEASGFAFAGDAKGYFSIMGLKSSHVNRKAYGYLYSHAGDDPKSLHDLNREKEGPFFEESPHLPIPHYTHDIYSVSSQVFQGQFRPYRSDVGMLSDPVIHTNDIGKNLGVDMGLGNLVKAGFTFGINNINNHSGYWSENNRASGIFRFVEKMDNDPSYRPVYFKQTGELTAMQNEEAFTNLGGFDPFYIEVGHLDSKKTIVAGGSGIALNDSDDIIRKNREALVNQLSYLTADEASHAAVEKQLHSSGDIILDGLSFENKFTINKEFMPRMDSTARKAHHISEMMVTRDDGSRLVYGLPVYNRSKIEVSFNVSDLTPDPLTGLVTYDPIRHASVTNASGKDQYFSRTKTPPHAYAYLLTSLLSPDYIDLTGNGPTPDDLGSYTLFHYNKANDDYGWRMPFGDKVARFNPGLLSANNDQTASYLYGRKELWYLSFIETRHFIAQFYTSNRKDGYSIDDEHGQSAIVDTSFLHKLDSIKLFSAPDVVEHGKEAEALKSVYFEYDYSLAPGQPGSLGNAGKLTLTRLSFAYGKSNRSRHNPFEFTYTNNKSYHNKAVDRWGFYKPEDYIADNDKFPYSAKIKTDADEYAASWLLSTIRTPANSHINIDYESDDYAFVQDEKAMDMLPVMGFAETEAGPIDDVLYNGLVPNRYLFFKMKDAASTVADVKKYLTGIEELYFNCEVEIDPGIPGIYETIKGFIPLENPELGIYAGDNEIGWVKLPGFSTSAKDEADDSGNYHPITKAAAQYIKKYNPILAYGLDELDGEDFKEILIKLTGLVTKPKLLVLLDFATFFAEFRTANRGKRINPMFSFARFNNPDGFKFGGGARVKQIRVTDNWGEMTGDPEKNYEYGKQYEYNELTDDGYRSSGVALYEPMIGNDENPFHLPARYFIKKKLNRDVNDFGILPVNEYEFPNPQVGYSKVSVMNLPRPGITRNATGKQVYEFYTAKDFPVFTGLTRIDRDTRQSFFNPFAHRNHATTSQGYSIELNNMHGKEKSIQIFSENDFRAPISGIRYHYKTEGLASNKLSNIALSINPETGEIEENLLGVDYEVVVDSRSSSMKSFSGAAAGNLDYSLAGPIPIITLSLYPELFASNVQYRSLVSNKIITRSGILDRVESFDNGNSLTSSQLLYDQLTGEAIVSGVQNEFHDTLYTTKIPAYWYYPGMGHAYLNQHITFNTVSVSGGLINDANVSQFLRPGDELMIFDLIAEDVVFIEDTPTLTIDSKPFIAWVLQKTGDDAYIINRQGDKIPDGTYHIKVLRSGDRNHLMNSKYMVSSMQNPIVALPLGSKLNFEQVVDAQKMDYSDFWETYIGLKVPKPISNCECQYTRDSQDGIIWKNLTDFLRILLDYRDLSITTDTPEPVIGSWPFISDQLEEASPLLYLHKEGNSLTIWFQNPGGSQRCHITMRIPDALSFPDFVSIPPEANLLLEFNNLPGYQCNDQNEISFNIDEKDMQGFTIATHNVVVESDCFSFLSCHQVYVPEAPIFDCDLVPGSTMNPYVNGILGNWRNQSTYSFFTERQNFGDPRTSGIFTSFFIDEVAMNAVDITPMDPLGSGFWMKKLEINITDPYNKILEFTDSIGISSSQIFGYNFHLNIASAYNARYQDIFYDGFEDYAFENQSNTPFDGTCLLPSHSRIDSLLGYEISEPISLDTLNFHSGFHSLRIQADTSIQVQRNIEPYCNPASRSTIFTSSYYLQECDIIKSFAPNPGRYVLSAWIKETPESGIPILDTLYEETGISISITAGGVESIDTFYSSGPIIEGWQQLNTEFTIPNDPNLETIKLGYLNLSPSGQFSFFDDVRIQPFNSSMQTNVYDPVSLRLVASQDDRNYTTFYEYDQQGILTRTKKETERGILTIQEFRNSRAHQVNFE